MFVVYFATSIAGPALFFCSDSLSSCSSVVMRSCSLAFFFAAFAMMCFVVDGGVPNEIRTRLFGVKARPPAPDALGT